MGRGALCCEGASAVYARLLRYGTAREDDLEVDWFNCEREEQEREGTVQI
jgi:hypothetical protein